MIIRTKKYITSLSLIFLLGGLTQVKAQQVIQSPQIHCLAVDASGGVALTWDLPPYLDNSFQNYQIFSSTTYTSGYTVVLPDITTPAQTTYYASPTSANAGQVFYYITTDTGAYTPALDSMSTIYINAVASTLGVAKLTWNAIHHPLLPSSSSWYRIYRLSPLSPTWFLIDSVKSTNEIITYNDTIEFCDSVTLKYRVEITDSSNGGCISISNISDSLINMHEILPPDQAVMDTLSVTSTGNAVNISWSKSPNNNVIGYIIYEYFLTNPNPVWLPIDTVWGINTDSLKNFTKGPYPSDSSIGNPSGNSLGFEVAYLDACGKVGPISNPQKTIFLKEKPDRCEQTNTLTWNAYEFLAGNIGGLGIGGYRVFVSTDLGITYHLLATTGRGTTTFTDSNLNTPQIRWYFVQVFDSLHHDTTASSNIVKYTVATALKPDYDYLRDASVVNYSSEIMVTGYIDTLASPLYLSGAGYYELQRSADSAGGFKTIDSVAVNHHSNSVSFLDNTANPNRQSYRYQIITQDSCYHNLDTTNLGQTMYLTAVGQSDGINTLTWNDYRDWYSAPQYYAILRSEDGVTYNLVTTVAYSNAGSNIYADNIKNITQGQGTFYYYIMAVENGSPYPFIDTSYSNTALAYQDPTVFIPNAFNPKGVNRIFKPVGVFIDVTGYDFIILNRWGVVQFESNDPNIGWDGSGKNGKLVEEGVYVYLLTYTSSKGEYFQRKGTVTLLK